MADSSIGATCAQTKPVSLLNVIDRLCTVRHFVLAVEMMASDLDDAEQKSAFIRVVETIREHVCGIEADLDAIRAGEAA